MPPGHGVERAGRTVAPAAHDREFSEHPRALARTVYAPELNGKDSVGRYRGERRRSGADQSARTERPTGVELLDRPRPRIGHRFQHKAEGTACGIGGDEGQHAAAIPTRVHGIAAARDGDIGFGLAGTRYVLDTAPAVARVVR